MDPPNAGGVRTVMKNIDYLARQLKMGTIASGRRLRRAEVDLRVRIGNENDPLFDELRAYAKEKGIPLHVHTY